MHVHKYAGVALFVEIKCETENELQFIQTVWISSNFTVTVCVSRMLPCVR